MTETPSNRWTLPLLAFVGRRSELRALDDLVGASRAVTVLGPPGIGKTRLVLEWMRGASDRGRWAGGVAFCDLSEAQTSDEVVRLVAKALGTSLVGAEAGANVAHVGRALAGRGESVLVLDNFEHVVEAAHDLVPAWLGAARGARVIVTSRERLRVEGENVFDLGPVDREEGVELFVARARAVRAGYTPSPSEAGVIAELVRELDHVPLAIELAAARARVLSPRDILARLEQQRFEVLVAPHRGGGARRQPALVDAIEESWTLLPPWGRAALAQISVFRGGFDVAAAEAVVDLSAFEGAPPVVDALEALSDKSLVALPKDAPVEGATLRFTLHASIRAYAAQKLDESRGADAALARHAAYYADAGRAWAERLQGPDALDALAAFRVDVENMGAALRRVLAGPAEPEAADRALALATALAEIRSFDGPYALRASALEEAVAFADRTTPDPARLIEALDASVLALVAVARPDAARACSRRAADLAARDGDRVLLARTLSTLGLVFGMEGRTDEAAARLGEALRLAREAKSRLYEGRVTSRLAWLEWASGDLERARERFREAVAVHEDAGDRVFAAMNTGYLAVVTHELGDLESPRRLLEYAIEEHARLGHRRIEAELCAALAALLHESGALDDARASYRRALDLYRRLGHPRDEAALLVDIARVALDEGALDEAREAFVEAIPRARATENTTALVEAEAGLGVVAACEGKVDEAEERIARAEAIAGPGPREAELVRLLRAHVDLARARLARTNGDATGAARLLEEARGRIAAASVRGPGGAIRFKERRLAVAHLARGVEHAAASLMPPAPAPGEDAVAMIVRADRRSVRTPAGVEVDLERHRALWRIVEKFVDVHARSPGRPVPVEDLVAAGWPDERVRVDAGARRVYTALSTLRRWGLREWLVKRDEGYHLAVDVRVVSE